MTELFRLTDHISHQGDFFCIISSQNSNVTWGPATNYLYPRLYAKVMICFQATLPLRACKGNWVPVFGVDQRFDGIEFSVEVCYVIILNMSSVIILWHSRQMGSPTSSATVQGQWEMLSAYHQLLEQLIVFRKKHFSPYSPLRNINMTKTKPVGWHIYVVCVVLPVFVYMWMSDEFQVATWKLLMDVRNWECSFCFLSLQIRQLYYHLMTLSCMQLMWRSNEILSKAPQIECGPRAID